MSDDRRVALITGAGSGIGRAVAVQLNELGWRVVLVGRRQGPLDITGAMLEGEQGSAWIATRADVGTPEGCRAMIDASIKRFGRLDALCNNAGIAPSVPLTDLTHEQITLLFDVNAIGPVWATCLAARLFAEQRSGVVVNTSSIATQDPFPGLGAYGAAKAATEVIARAIRNELGSKGVRAYAVAPGAVETEMLRAIISEEMLPSAATLSPEAVAAVIVACVTGETDAENGGTIYLPSPG